MDTTNREAVLFYKDGQVKFTHRVVAPNLFVYVESHVHADPLQKAIDCHRTEFIHKGDIFGYALYEESYAD